MDTICGTCRTLLCSKRHYRGRQKALHFPLNNGPSRVQIVEKPGGTREPGDKTFSELVSIMTQHHSSPPSEIVQRYRFHTRFWQLGESVATYVSELRSLAQWCNFGDSLDAMLRDRLVCGLSNDSIQRRLLSEASLTFKKALELAQGHEARYKAVGGREPQVISPIGQRTCTGCTRVLASGVDKTAMHTLSARSKQPNVTIAGELAISRIPVAVSRPVDSRPKEFRVKYQDDRTEGEDLSRWYKKVARTERKALLSMLCIR